MKKKLALIALPIALLAASTTMAENLCGVTPYVGADAEFRYMSFHKGFGKNIFAHNYPQANLYIGLRFNDYFAVEAGYEATARKTRTSTLHAGDVSLGAIVPAPDTPQFNSTSQIKALHANLVGTFPICERYRLQFIGMAGIARLKANIVRTFVTLDGFAIDPPITSTFIKRKSVLILGAGVQHMINCNWGVRAMLKWENSNRLKLIDKETADLFVKAKNSVIYSLGAFYNF